MKEPTAYSYTVVPKEPVWSDTKPAFDRYRTVGFEHPDERFEDVEGVTATNIVELYPKSEFDWPEGRSNE